MKNNVFKSVMSLVVLGIFILIAVGYTDYNLTSEYLGNGLYSETITSKEDKDYKNVTIGKKNELGFWEGEVNITKSFEGEIYKEKVNYVDGERHGKSHVVFSSGEYFYCYDYGVRITCPDDDGIKNDNVNRNISGYDILNEKYPWFVYLHLSNGQEQSEKFHNFMDVVEANLDKLTIAPADFDETYYDILSDLEDESISDANDHNTSVRLLLGLNNYKRFEFRRAILESYYKGENRSFPIVKNTYPSLIETMQDFTVSESDFTLFCDDFDKRMDSKINIAINNPMFVDSIDQLMFQVFSELADEEEDDDDGRKILGPINKIYQLGLLKNSVFNSPKNIRSIYGNGTRDGDTFSPLDIMIYMMGQKINDGDVVRASIRDAYFNKKSIPTLATITTEFINISSTAVSIKGYVIENGGANVTERGIVWDTTFQPTVASNKMMVGRGNGEYEADIKNLKSYKRYFFRSYAINSAGIVYGNVVEVKTGLFSSVYDALLQNLDIQLYPNPTKGLFTVQFKEVHSNIQVELYNSIGEAIFSRNYTDNDRVEGHLNHVLPGVYWMVIRTNHGKSVNKLVVL